MRRVQPLSLGEDQINVTLLAGAILAGLTVLLILVA